MPPMARTQSTRKETSINALDDLDLDDMFEGEENGLFDDEFDLLGDIVVDEGPTPSSPVQREEEAALALKKSKRMVKRKVRDIMPSDDDEDDDEGFSRRKKRPSKKARAGIAKKAKSEVEVPPTLMAPKNKKAKAASQVTISEKVVSQSAMVAAAGQFGGRLKRANYLHLSRGLSKAKAKPANSDQSSAAPLMSEISTVEKPIEPYHVQQSSLKRGRSHNEVPKTMESFFCGLQSSLTFYPFMSTLPPEASMKGCSKHFSSLEKINASLSGSMPGPEIEDAIVKLLLLYDPVPSANKKHSLSAAALTTRKLISGLTRQTIVSELASVSMLVKRQHDFLAQSLENMERWCKHNFSGDDYRAVYGGEIRKPILPQLTSPLVRVRIKCASFKETKAPVLLVAYIPMIMSTKPTPSTVLTTTSSTIKPTNTIPQVLPLTAPVSGNVTNKKKKRVETSANPIPPANGKIDMVDDSFVPYSELPPNGRRQRILDYMAKHAMLLETKQADMDETRRKALEKQHLALQKVVEDDELLSLNTMTLWKWVDKACFFSDFSEYDIRDLLTYQPQVAEEHILWEETNSAVTRRSGKESLCDRLLSLLVDVNSDSDDDDENDDNNSLANSEGDFFLEPNMLEISDETDRPLLDLGELSIEERAFVLLRAVGLMDESRPSPESYDTDLNLDDDDGEKVEFDGLDEDESLFDNLLRRMKEDLSQIDQLNNSRTAFLESAARAHLELSSLAKRQDERNSHFVAKYNHLAKKQRETKRSTRTKLPKKDEDWVPW